MTSYNESRFLSQRIVQKGTALAVPPLVVQDGTRGIDQEQDCNNNNNNNNNNKRSEVSPSAVNNNGKQMLREQNNSGNHNSYSQSTWGWKINVTLIPNLPVYYFLEPASTTLKNIPINVAETRISEFLRLHSIYYTFNAESVRLECCTSSMLKFIIQFWTSKNDFHEPPSYIVELQRRQGSVIEFQTIRRVMFRAILTGEQKNPVEYWKPRYPVLLPDTIMAEVNEHYDQEEGRTDAVRLCVNLLESSNLDQHRLGLESLRMLTDPSVVSREDAVIIARDMLFRQTELGQRLQDSLALCFGIAAAAAGGGYNAEPDEHGELMIEYTRGAYLESIHSLGLAILANALQLVVEDNNPGHPAGSIDSDFLFKLVTEDLFYNVERAVYRPNEAAISAKCIRLLSTLERKAHSKPAFLAAAYPTGLVTCITQAYQHGKRCHLSLQHETQQLLAMDIDQLVVH